jgi:hypothetical protein
VCCRVNLNIEVFVSFLPQQDVGQLFTYVNLTKFCMQIIGIWVTNFLGDYKILSICSSCNFLGGEYYVSQFLNDGDFFKFWKCV